MAETQSLSLCAVKEGDALPDLAYDVTPLTVVLGAMATRDWRPQHHDYKFATERNGVQDIFLNTPNQAAWFERYLTDWTGPKGRIGRIKFRMKDSVFPGDTMTFTGHVTKVGPAEADCGWVDLAVELKVGDRVCTACEARMALPASDDGNPWSLEGDAWQP